MTVKNPRITVTVNPEIHELVHKLSDLSGTSVSSFVGDLLQQAAPTFVRMVQLLEAVHAVRQEAMGVPSEVVANLDEAHRRIEQHFGLVLDAIEEGSAPLIQEGEKVLRRRRKGVS